jgi:ribonuclease VapC
VIAVDTSALMAITLNEPHAEACAEALALEDELLISAATFTEAFIVALGRQIDGPMSELLDELGPTVVPVSAETPARIRRIYAAWGKGHHPARLNIIDCFAYDVARQYDCALLYVGNDFAQTDISPALAL